MDAVTPRAAADLLTGWRLDPETGNVLGPDGEPVLFVAASRMDKLDASGGEGIATRIGRLAAAGPDLYDALDVVCRQADEETQHFGYSRAVVAARALLARARGQA